MKKILIVDDEPEVCGILSKKLEAEGFVCISASDGIEGLKKAQEQSPDIILLDIMMPRKNGFSMLKEIQQNKDLCGIPVIMVSAKSESDFLFQGQDLGATDYLIKPIDFRQLLKYIRKYT